MRWTRRCRKTDGALPGEAFWRRRVSRTAKSCGPDIPTLISSLRDDDLASDGDNKPGSPGRARRKPLKPSRRECRFAPGVPVVTNARAIYSTRAAAGALGIRRSLRPLFMRDTLMQQLGRIAPRESGGVSCSDVIARSACDEAIDLPFALPQWIASLSLAMTAPWLFENGIGNHPPRHSGSRVAAVRNP